MIFILEEIKQKTYKAGLKQTFTAALEEIKMGIIRDIFNNQPIIQNNQPQTQ